MRKNLLSLSIAAMIGGLGFAGAASAGVAYEAVGAAPATPANTVFGATTATTFVANVDGIGHNLLTPYYTVQNGNGTLLSIVNTDAVNGKAVKVRFRGAANSDDVFDFTLLMSPGDVWSGNVYADGAGNTRLFSADNTCTLPSRATLYGTPFQTGRVFGADATAKMAQTREGYVEIFNMADIPPTLPGTAPTVDATQGVAVFANPLFTAIKHVNGTNPCGAAASDAALPAAVLALQSDPALGAASRLGTASGVATTAATNNAVLSKGLWMPTTGLMGSWTIINQTSAFVSWSANMMALQAVDGAGKAAAGRVVFSPQMVSPVGGDVSNILTADPLLRTPTGAATETGIVGATQQDFPDMSTPYLIHTGATTPAGQAQEPVVQADALTSSLAVKTVNNEYVTNPAIHANTDWVFSMPTRRYAVGVNYANVPAPITVFNTLATTQVTTPSPFFTSINTKMDTSAPAGQVYQACVVTGSATPFVARDQEETTVSSGFTVSPGTAGVIRFCGETSVLTFNGTASLGATIAKQDIATGFQNGWAQINTAGNLGAVPPATIGLPVLGHSFVRMVGNTVDGVTPNYAITQAHRFTR